jgi:hypothetical protein
MASARRLMLLMLPGLAPLLASGLHFGKGRPGARGKGRPLATTAKSLGAEGTPGTPGSPGAESPPDTLATPGTPAAARKVLLIVAGVNRRIEETWPALEQSLIVPNEGAGYSFTIFFCTNTGLACHEDSPLWKSRKCEEPTDRETNVNQIKKVFAPREVTVIDYATLILPGISETDSTGRIMGSAGMCHGEADDDEDTDDACSGWSWWARVHHVLDRVGRAGLGRTFDRVVALRPDVVLQWAPTAGAPPRSGPVSLRLDEMCEKKPGLSFVTASWKRVRGVWLHDRDMDFMHILCPGEKLPVYERAMRAPMAKCGHKPTPRLPPGFHSTKGWHDRAIYCKFVQVFQLFNISLGLWDDDYHLSWPKRFCTHKRPGEC